MTTATSPHPAPEPAPPPPPPAWEPRSQRRRRITAVAAAVVVACAVVVAAIVASLALLGGHTSSSSTSASQPLTLYRQALAAVRASSGCHYVAVTSGGGSTQRIVGNAGRSDGTQVITFNSSFGSEQFTLLLLNRTVYFKGNVPALQDQIGVDAAKASTLTGTWISVVSGDGPYNVLSPGITLNDQAGEMGLQPSSITQVTEAGGTAATRISGGVPPQNGAPAGTGHLDIATSTQLPIVYVTTVGGNGATLTSTTTFSAWGSAPSVSAPSGAVAWSSLGATPPPGGYGNGGGGGGGGPATPTPLTV